MSGTLLEQFVAEAAELLADIDEALLRLERDPSGPALDAVFRAAHTLKGSSGLFDLPEVTRLMHAAEDLLDAAREQEGLLDCVAVDLLLEAFDAVRGWLPAVAADGRVPTGGHDRADVLARRLAAGVPGQPGPERPRDDTESADDVAVSAPWLAVLPAPRLAALASWLQESGARLRAFRYAPDEGCFFRGEDPVRLLREVPAMAALRITAPSGLTEDYDEYACRTVVTGLTRASRQELAHVFRYSPEQVQVLEVSAEALREALVLQAAGGTHGGVDGAVDGADGPREDDGSGCAAAQDVCPDAHPAVRPTDPVPILPAPVAGPRTLRVEQVKVDRLLDLVGELVVATNALPFVAAAALEQGQRGTARRVAEEHAVLSRVGSSLQQAVMDVRMLPLGVAFARVPRLVRDLSRQLGREVRLHEEGAEVTADKDVVEMLAEPLVHLLRNSLDHGVEPPEERVAVGKPREAELRVGGRADGDAVVVEVSDDGRGVDLAAVRARALERGLVDEAELQRLTEQQVAELVFAPGFSTARQVSDVSGRGVGMDAVRSAVERAGGTVRLVSRQGAGTTVQLRLPTTMAVSRVLVVTVAGQRFGLPLEAVVETLRTARGSVQRLAGRPAVVLRDEVVPVLEVAAALGLPGPSPDVERCVLVVRGASGPVGLAVDALHRDAEVVVKPVPDGVAAGSELSGTALLGDGHVLLVLDAQAIVARGAGMGVDRAAVPA